MIVLWEYMHARFQESENPGAVIDTLNKLGSEGWEFTGHTENYFQWKVYLMKRSRVA